MFAFAIWDEKEEKLFAARDRFGEKPFYYYEDEDNFIFASEMKALWAIGIEKKTDNKMLLNYLTLGHVQNCVDKEQTFFEDIYALPPSHYLTYIPASKQLCKDHNNTGALTRKQKLKFRKQMPVEKFTELVTDSVKRRLRSDVTVGYQFKRRTRQFDHCIHH